MSGPRGTTCFRVEVLIHVAIPKPMAEMRTGFVAAIAIGFAIVTAVNFYVFDRLTGLLGLGWWPLSLAYALVLAGLLAVGFAVRTSSGMATKWVFVLVTTAYGLEFAALSMLVPFEVVGLLLQLPKLESGVAILVFVITIAAISFANAQTLRVRAVGLPFVSRLRVVQLSDLHIGAVHGAKYLAKVVGTVNSLRPDLVLITGDIVSGAVPPGGSQRARDCAGGGG